MDALLTAIVIWLSANYGLPATFDHPRIERVPSIEMATLRYKDSLMSREIPGAEAVAGSVNTPIGEGMTT